jgi:hypothetical protein
MRTALLISLSLLLVQQSFGQEKERKRYRYRPHTIKEAVIQLGRIHDDSTKSLIMNMTEDKFLAGSHMGMGMWIRNKWGLWRGGKLKSDMKSWGQFDPDEMSSLILKCYYRELHGLEWDLPDRLTKEEVDEYQRKLDDLRKK